MSTKEETVVIRANLQRLDREVKKAEKNLGFFRRIFRRYFGLRTAVVAKLASMFGIVKGLLIACGIGGKVFLSALALKMPLLAVVVEWALATFEGAVSVASNTS